MENLIEKVKNIGRIIGGTAHSLFRGIAREGGGMYLWLKNKITGRDETFLPQTGLEKWFLGEEEVKSRSPLDIVMDWTIRPTIRLGGKIGASLLGREFKPEEAGKVGRFFLGELPLSPLEVEYQRYKQSYGNTLGTMAFFGFTALDAWVPIGPGQAGKVFLRKELLKDLAKKTDKNAIKDTLLREIPELHHPKISKYVDRISESLVNVNKVGEVRKTLQSQFDAIGKELGVDLAKIRKEMKEFKPGEYVGELIETKAEKIAKTATEGIKEPPIPPRPPKNPPLDNIPFRPEFNPKGGEFRVRGYFKNLWENKPDFQQRVADQLDELSIYYKPIKNKEIIDRAVAEMMQYETLEEAYKKIGRKLEKTIPRDPGRLSTEIVKNVLLSEAYWETGMRVRAIKIMDNIINLYGEIGQALQSARFTPKLSPAYLSAWAPKKFTHILKEMAEKRGKTLSDEFLNDIGQKIRKIYTEIEVPAEKERALMELINKEIAPKLPLSFFEKINLYRYGNMLSSWVTHLRNITGNIVQLVNRNFFVLPMEAVVEYIKHPFNPALRTIAFSDLPQIWKHTFGSLGLALETAIRTFQKGEVSTRMFDFLKGSDEVFETMVNFSRYHNVSLPLKPASAISRFLESTDKFFSTLIAEGEKFRLMNQAQRAGQKITKSLEKQIMEQAQKVAEEYFFRRNLGVDRERLSYFAQTLDFVGDWALKIRNAALESKNPAIKTTGLGMSMLVPFIRTPINIGIAMLEHSPLGFFRPKDSYTSEKLAQAIVGSIFTATGAWYAFNDRTTWVAPKNQKERAIFYENRKPFSININGVDVPLLYFGPYGVALAIPAALKWALTERKPEMSAGLSEALFVTALETARFITTQTSLEGLTRLGAVLSGDADWKNMAFVGGHLGQYIPLESFLRSVGRIVDPVHRKIGADFWGPVKNDIPWLKRTLEAYENIGGESDYDWWKTFIPYQTGKESMPFSLALKELQIDRRRREAWRLYEKDQLKIEDIEKWVNLAKLGVKERTLTEKDIDEGMKVVKALKDYDFKDIESRDAALRFVDIFLEILAKNNKEKEFAKVWEDLPDRYKEKILDIKQEREEAEQLPIEIPYGIEHRRIEEKVRFLDKYFQDVIPKLSEDKIELLIQILRARGILTDNVEEAFVDFIEKKSKELSKVR